MTQVFLGLAPVNALTTGWCVLRTGDSQEISALMSGVGTSINTTLAAADEYLSETPNAVGIAAPLYWTTKDDREADRIVRGMVLSLGGKSASVPALPALPGAKIIGGIILASKAHQRWATSPLTEAAPEALLSMDSGAKNFIESTSVNSEAEKQAVLAAYTALAGHEQRQGWQDLRRFDNDIFAPGAGMEAAFWFPGRAC